MHLDLSWKKLVYNWSECELRFALQGMTDTAPTNTNLRRWGNPTLDPSCILCGRPATLRHVLNACSSALNQGRFTWRHDSVLAVLRRKFNEFWTSQTTWKAVQSVISSADQPFANFHSAGVKPLPCAGKPKRTLRSQALLLHAVDWEFLFDLPPHKLVFPIEIAATSQRPDIVIFSRILKTVILIELTVPLEDRTSASHDRKLTRYKSLSESCVQNGWHCSVFAVEVGCLGYVSLSLLKCLEELGFSRAKAREVRDEVSRVALRCSYLLFLRRNIRQWNELQLL